VSDDREYLTEEEARRLWQRAAQLQAEAAARAEASAGEGEGGEGADDASGSSPRGSTGYALTHVRAAAIEAGIEPEFVDAALAEATGERLVAGDAAGKHRISRWILGNPDPMVTVRRRIRAAPRRVLDAMEAILPHDPFRLTLVDRRGDPLAGGMLTFEIQSQGIAAIGRGGFAADLQMASDLTKIHITLQPAPDGSGTEMLVRGPVWAGWPLAASVSSVLVLAGAVGGAGLGYGLATVALPILLVAVVAAVLLGTGGGAGGLALARALTGFSKRKDEHALNTLVSAVAAEAEGGWFAAGSPVEAEASGTPRISPQQSSSSEGDGH